METYAQMKVRHEREVKELILKFSSKHTVAETARKIGMDKDKLRRFAHYHGISFKKKYGEEMTKCDTVYRKKTVTLSEAPWEMQ
jgi:hypothetical protein